jgi:hypothetical protein
MATPTTPVPTAVETWITRARYLRWLDALAAWLVLLAVAAELLPEEPGGIIAVSSLALLVIGVMLRPLRPRWRPVSGWVGVAISRTLRPGQRAWFVRDGHADAVLVTGRRGLRLTIAAPNVGAEETLTVRRTRVFLIPLSRFAA